MKSILQTNLPFPVATFPDLVAAPSGAYVINIKTDALKEEDGSDNSGTVARTMGNGIKSLTDGM